MATSFRFWSRTWCQMLPYRRLLPTAVSGFGITPTIWLVTAPSMANFHCCEDLNLRFCLKVSDLAEKGFRLFLFFYRLTPTLSCASKNTLEFCSCDVTLIGTHFFTKPKQEVLSPYTVYTKNNL